MKKLNLKSFLVGACCVLGLAGGATADRAPTGPDFDEVESARKDVERYLVTSDSRRKIAPSDVVTFEFDSASLSHAAADQLESVAAWMRKHPGKQLVIEGHTDGIGSEVYNVGLATRRASAVRDQLVAIGVSSSRLVVVVYGEDKLASTATPSVNRRVVLYPSARPAPVVGKTSVEDRGAVAAVWVRR